MSSGITRRLNLPPGPALALGLALGAGLGLVMLVGIGGVIGVVLCLPVLGAAAWWGFRAEPVVEIVPPPEPAPVEPPLPREVEDIPGLLTMIELPGGTFWMGSKTHHEVTLSPFAMGKFPVTRVLYRKIMESGPGNWREKDDGKFPANYISWIDAVKFCNALSDRCQLKRCYQIQESSVIWDQEADGYRLPTEAEWEYATRAGTESRYFFGDDAEWLREYAWFRDNSSRRVHPVGEKAANPWGLHDVLGNVWEWSWDWYGPYPDKPATNPRGPADGDDRLLRGGSFVNGAVFLRSANRDGDRPERRNVLIGFRCVRAPRRQP